VILPGARRAVGTAVFAATVIVLLAVAAGGFFLYATKSTAQETMTVTSSESMAHSSSETMSASAGAIAFTPAAGQMFGMGWLVVAPLGNGSYAVTVHATGLESASMGDYIVEAAQSSGQMARVPIAGTNDTLSEFTADSGGNGNLFLILHQAPSSEYESVSIVYLPDMEMQNATVVATASLMM
jgi:hypothetical protein